MGKQSSQLIMKTVLMFTCLVLAVSAQQRGGLQCSDGNKPTCTCDNGTVVTRPRFNPCGDRTKPTCVCADGSRPTCANGVAPVCRDGSAPNPSAIPPCSDGLPRCEDGGRISCADGTRLPGFLASLVG